MGVATAQEKDDYVYEGVIRVKLHGHGLDEAHRTMREAVKRIEGLSKVDSAYQDVTSPRAVYDGDRVRRHGDRGPREGAS